MCRFGEIVIGVLLLALVAAMGVGIQWLNSFAPVWLTVKWDDVGGRMLSPLVGAPIVLLMVITAVYGIGYTAGATVAKNGDIKRV